MSVDDLLADRTRFSEQLETARRRNPQSETIRPLELAIKLMDRAIQMAHAKQSAQDDAESAVYAFEKARFTGDWEAAQREFNFYLTKAAYLMARTFLKTERVAEEILAKNPEYAEHIRNGTIPEFF